MPSKLESEFAQELWEAFHEAKNKYKFKSTRFVQMMSDYGAVDTAHRLLATGPSNIQSGLTELWRYNRLDLSIEAKVLNIKYRSLFPDTLRDVAHRRLEDRGYFKASTVGKKRKPKEQDIVAPLLRRGRPIRNHLRAIECRRSLVNAVALESSKSSFVVLLVLSYGMASSIYWEG